MLRPFVLVFLYIVWVLPSYALTSAAVDNLVLDGKLANSEEILALQYWNAAEVPSAHFDGSNPDQPNLFTRFNMLVNPEAINFYIVPDADLQALDVDVDCGCRALEVDNVRFVFCSAEFLGQAPRQIARQISADTAQVDALESAVLTWIVSHEIGHHQINDSRLRGEKLSAPAELKLERQADAYAAQVFAWTQLRQPFLAAAFANSEARPKRSDWMRNLANGIAAILNLPLRHPPLDERIVSFAATVADTFADGKDFRGLLAKVSVRNNDVCGNGAAQFGRFSPEGLLTQYWMSGLDERARFAPLLERVLASAPPDGTETHNLLLAAACQAKILAMSNKTGCTLPDDLRNSSNPLVQLSIVQTERRFGSVTPAEENDLLGFAFDMVQPLLEYFETGDHFSFFHYLSWITSTPTIDDCGRDGAGLVDAPLADCATYAFQNEGNLQGSGTEDILFMVNTMLALEPENPPEASAMLHLLAIYSAQHFKLGTQPVVIGLIDKLGRIALEEGHSQIIGTLGMAQYKLGRSGDATRFYRAAAATAMATVERRTWAAAEVMQYAELCGKAFATSCALELYRNAIDILSGSPAPKDASDDAPAITRLHTLSEFETARFLIWDSKVDEGVAMLEAQLDELALDAGEQIGLLETIAEGYIWNGDAAKAETYLQRARALYSEAERSLENQRSSLSYDVAVAFMQRDWKEAATKLDEFDAVCEKMFGTAISATLSPFAINGHYLPAIQLKDEVLLNAGL